MEPESTAPTEQSQKAPKDTHLTIRVHKKVAISIGVIVIILLAFVLSFDTLNKSLMRTFPQLNPLSNDIPEVTVVEEEYIDVSADPNRAIRQGIKKCGIVPDTDQIDRKQYRIEGPYWLLDCQHIVWKQELDIPPFVRQDDVDRSSEGIYIMNLNSKTILKIADRGHIQKTTTSSVEYTVNDIMQMYDILNKANNQQDQKSYTHPSGKFSFSIPAGIVIKDNYSMESSLKESQGDSYTHQYITSINERSIISIGDLNTYLDNNSTQCTVLDFIECMQVEMSKVWQISEVKQLGEHKVLYLESDWSSSEYPEAEFIYIFPVKSNSEIVVIQTTLFEGQLDRFSETKELLEGIIVSFEVNSS